MTYSEIINDCVVANCPYCDSPVKINWNQTQKTISVSCCVTMTSKLMVPKDIRFFNLDVVKLVRKWNNHPREKSLQKQVWQDQRNMKAMQHKIDKLDGQLDRYAKRISELEENNGRK